MVMRDHALMYANLELSEIFNSLAWLFANRPN